MKIRQLFLRNARSIKSLDLDFRDPVTEKPLSRVVLAGANGSGKTTILESIFGLLSAAPKFGDGAIDGSTAWQDFKGAGIELGADTRLQLMFDVSLPNDSGEPLSIYYGANDPLETASAIERHAEVWPQPPRDESRRFRLMRQLVTLDSSVFAKLAESIRNASQREALPVGSVIYFPHNRSLPAVSQGELGFEPRSYQWAYTYQPSDQWKGSTESYLFSLNYLDLEDRDRRVSANRFIQAVDLVNSVLDRKRIARVEKGRVVVETADGQTHGLDGLSSGEKQLVLLLVEINRRIVPGSVILIDEPEISLHPTWQRGLIAALDKIIEQYDAQVILATHSLEIATSVMPHEVINLSDLDNLPRGVWKPEVELAA